MSDPEDAAAQPALACGRFTVQLPGEDATVALGAQIGAELEPGDLVALHGAVGAGKTTLARAILRSHLGDPELEAPSPTFTLVQSYDGPRGPVFHVDLYRVAGEGELVELGFDDWREGAAVLVEWPERAPTLLDRPRLDVTLSLVAAADGREAVLSGKAPLRERLERARALDALLASAGWHDAERARMGGDASSRVYHRLTKPSGETAIVMISPPRPDGPPVRRGKPYSRIARLAESVHAFEAIDRGLLAEGFSAPTILAQDLEAGLLLLEDFGSEPVVDEHGPMVERYGEATRCLAALHCKTLPRSLPANQGGEYAIPPYDLEAMLIETELLLDWYFPQVIGTQPSGSVRAEFGHLWRELAGEVLAGPQTWTLRDYHSPNLVWLPGREGIARIGLLDFQDAVIGPPAYDVASLLQDARVSVPPEIELRLLGLYAAARRAADPDFDMPAFATAYAIMAAQRATKILGIFARLSRRDGKPHYLAHLPRIRGYLARNIAHPALARLRDWYAAQIPDTFGSAEPRSGPPSEPTEEAPGLRTPDLGGQEADLAPVRIDEDGAERSLEQLRGGHDESPSPGGGSAPPPSVDAQTIAHGGADRLPLTRAMVLAAGLGTRMRPLTDTVPKPLVQVGGRTLLDHALARLKEAGISDAVVNVHYLADQIEAHVQAVDGLRITISDERDALLETGGGIKRALPLLGPDILVMNSDSLWTDSGTGNLGRLLAGWSPDTMEALLLLAPRESLGYDGRGDFTRAPDGRLARRDPGGVAPHVYAGVAILKASSFEDTPDGAFSLNLIFDRAIAADRLYGVVLDGEWLHVGTPDTIRAAEERLATIPH